MTYKQYPIETYPIRNTAKRLRHPANIVVPDNRKINRAVIPHQTLGHGDTGAYGTGSSVTGTTYASNHPTIAVAITRADMRPKRQGATLSAKHRAALSARRQQPKR